MLNDKLQKGQAFRLFTTSIGAMLVASILIVLLNPLLGFYDETGTYSYGGFWWANVISQAVLIVAVVVFCRVVKVDGGGRRRFLLYESYPNVDIAGV